PFVDLHIISVARYLKNPDKHYQKGIRSYLIQENGYYRLVFNYSKDVIYEGIFFKEYGTDFNNGIFKFLKNTETLQVQVTEDLVKSLTHVDMKTDGSSNDDF